MESSFNKLLMEHPVAPESRKMFGNLLKDYFPRNLLQVNLIMALYDMKIHEDIRAVRNIGNTFAFRYVKRLMDEQTIHQVWGSRNCRPPKGAPIHAPV